jgi:hypothetical protein
MVRCTSPDLAHGCRSHPPTQPTRWEGKRKVGANTANWQLPEAELPRSARPQTHVRDPQETLGFDTKGILAQLFGHAEVW